MSKEDIPEFLDRVIGVHTKEDLLKLRKGKVVIVGMGCDGCEVAEQLVRTGIGEITIIDGDVVEETNLNRQRLYGYSDIGKPKVTAAQERLVEISNHTKINTIFDKLSYGNGENYLKGHDVVVQGIDNISSRIIVHEISKKVKIPIVTMSGQPPFRSVISTVFPEGPSYQELFSIPLNKPVEKMTDDEKKKFDFELCCERAKHALEQEASKEWYDNFIKRKTSWSITLGRSPITGTIQTNEVIRLLTNKAPLAVAPRIISYDGNGLGEFNLPNVLVALLLPKEGKYWDYRLW